MYHSSSTSIPGSTFEYHVNSVVYAFKHHGM